MTETVLAALITGSFSVVGVVITMLATTKKQEKAAAVAQAIMETKISELTREVREHNNFATRVPAIEQKQKEHERRIGALEQYHKQPIH